jgi:alpha-glucoside transport system substrate-binding protein
VHALPPHELIALAERSVERSLSDDECRAFLAGGCPAEVEIPDDLPLRSGMESYGATTPGPRALAGTTVTLPAGGLPDDPAVAAELREFTAQTGIGVDFAIDERESLTGPDSPTPRPDVVLHSGAVPTWAEGRALDISEFIDAETLRSDFGDFLLGVGTAARAGGELTDGEVVPAIPVDLGLKGLVFYPRVEFREAGYEVPRTWDELVALSHEMVADGRSPWCFAFGSGPASGWPGTDLIESLVLRTGGVEVYDAWTSGELGFTSPQVMAAGRMANDLIFEPGFVLDGTASVRENWYDTQLARMFVGGASTPAEPECWMYHQADFVLRDLPGYGAEVGFFALPPIDADQQVPAIGTATYATAVVDRPEVRAFMEYLAGPEWGEIWAGDPYSDFISPNRRFDHTAYGEASDPAVALRLAMVTTVEQALDSGLFRFDASDRMPPEIGSGTGDEAGAFWTGMLDWVDGTRSIEQVFADIDAEWSALGADDRPRPIVP